MGFFAVLEGDPEDLFTDKGKGVGRRIGRFNRHHEGIPDGRFWAIDR